MKRIKVMFAMLYRFLVALLILISVEGNQSLVVVLAPLLPPTAVVSLVQRDCVIPGDSSDIGSTVKIVVLTGNMSSLPKMRCPPDLNRITVEIRYIATLDLHQRNI